jgi:hypothetical protein
MEPNAGSTDRELIEAFTEATARLSQAAAAKRVGVAQATVSEWRRGIYRALQPDTRQALERHTKKGNGGGDESNGGGTPREVFDDPWTEAMVREARAAEKRADAMILDSQTADKEADAALVRARAMEVRALTVAGFNPRARGVAGGVEPAVPPGVASDLLKRFLEELRQAVQQNQKASGDQNT